MIEYRVRSVSLLNLYNEVKSGQLIPDAYFQRNLVWRDIHRRDFIKTILLGYPFPQIFISKGKVDVETMSTVSCIVDGQQRTDAIMSYIEGVFDVEGKTFADLEPKEKSDFLKYEIAVIELDLENDDPKVLEIFQRINRTSNSLTAIEKLASQYSTSWYMLVARLLANQVQLERSDEDDFREDPNIPEDFFAWAKSRSVKHFPKLLNEKGIFNSREIARKVNLMYTLNIMTTILVGFYNRNDKAIEFLDNFAEEFRAKDELVADLERAAELILRAGFRARSYWMNKANVFSLIVSVVNIHKKNIEIDPQKMRTTLEDFEDRLSEDYRLAAAEAVNATRTRILRNRYLTDLIIKNASIQNKTQTSRVPRDQLLLSLPEAEYLGEE